MFKPLRVELRQTLAPLGVGSGEQRLGVAAKRL